MVNLLTFPDFSPAGIGFTKPHERNYPSKNSIDKVPEKKVAKITVIIVKHKTSDVGASDAAAPPRNFFRQISANLDKLEKNLGKI